MSLEFLDKRDDGRPLGPEDAPPQTALVPADFIAGRSLIIVIAIMTFLAALSAGAAMLVARASADWRKDASREASVQLRVQPGRDIDADVATAVALLQATPGVKEVRAYSRAESEALLAPWLGQGLDLSELPTPRMIVIKTDAEKRADLADLARKVAEAVPGAALDDHRIFLARLGDMADAMVAAAGGIFLLVVAAMAVVIASATRAAVATNREIVEVLHLVGAADSFVAREFQRRFLALGFRGAAIGGGAAILFFVGAQILVRRFAGAAGTDQVEAMFGAFDLGLSGYAAVIALSLAIAVATGALSQAIVLRRLKNLN